MKAEKVYSSVYNYESFIYHLVKNTLVGHGLCNMGNRFIGYRYQNKRKGFNLSYKKI